MRTHTFSLVLKTAAVDDEDCDRLYEAGCDDATVVTREGATYLAFDRDADLLETAIRSAIANVQAAGFDVAEVRMEPEAVGSA